MTYFCCDPRRKSAVEAREDWNGIDFLHVIDNLAAPVAERQTVLLVYFIRDLAADSIMAANVRIEGGERIRNIQILEVEIAPAQPKMLRVKVAAPGDFSFYRLKLVDALDPSKPPQGIDRLLASIEFSFKTACASPFDCADTAACPAPPEPAPKLNYLARDYATFRQLMLDRLALTVPGWQERNTADLGIVLTELLAYVADRIAYEQDAVATEAYLGTARLRTSVRRHARLVDYAMHDGCNARTFVQLVAAKGTNDLTVHHLYKDERTQKEHRTQIFTRTANPARVFALGSDAHREALANSPQVFEMLHDVTVFEAHNTMRFYTWGARECYLPAGATAATLRGDLTNLKAGDILILAEAKSPTTGKLGDADKSRRHAVKLTRVTLTDDPLGGEFEESKDTPQEPVPVTEIEWHGKDALPFALTLSSRSGTTTYEDVSFAYGNVVAVDHGMTCDEEELDAVPDADPALARVSRDPRRPCSAPQTASNAVRFRPQLTHSSITQACPFDADHLPTSAGAYLMQTLGKAVAQVSLREEQESERWVAHRDLLKSTDQIRHFVVEVEHDGRAWLRFGDNVFGRRPATGAKLHATYRVGNGAVGNVGESALFHLASAEPDIIPNLVSRPIAGIWNPLPARGGVGPETIESVRQRAPSAYRVQERAVTPADYEQRARQADSSVQRVGASLRWTGSWRTMFLTVDRFGTAEVDAEFERDLIAALEPYRLAGHDLKVDAPRYVPLELALEVCVKPDHFRADVETALKAVLSAHRLPDGGLGLFHPDNFSFGAAVYLSPIQAAALAIDGVDSVIVAKFRRQGEPATDAAGLGFLNFGRLEIPRLDNNPSFPDRGALELNLRGGR